VYKAEEIKNLAKDLGADLCGIAPAERFSAAPVGFRPADIYKPCKSVLVYAKQVPSQVLDAASCVPYTHMSDVTTFDTDSLGIEIALRLQNKGIKSVPLPSDDPFEHWEPQRMYGRAILSMRHAGWLAGLGRLGKNTLLINERFGNMIQLGAVLLDIDLEADPLAEYEVCPEGCYICLDSCPPGALDGNTVNQMNCRAYSVYVTEKGYRLKRCYICRAMCPHREGIA